MKSLAASHSMRALITALCMAAVGSLAWGQPAAGGARDVVTEEKLREQAEKAPSLKSLLQASAKPVVGAPPATQSSLWARSIILTDGEMFTLIPVGSILHVPPALQNRVAAAPVGKFTLWPHFLKRNSAWLGGTDVTLEMSRGDARAARTLLQSIAKDTRLLVAVYKGGPITILEAAPAGSTSQEK
ncbi:hypothetical protein WJU23_20880 [Prosthecobacter sp. SYSU 5D2]|uniref:hypothetical protein n=1 Tax=Prosthecobacter sp. SYSU 5D2 TaxID=3134134 RepID=UPI0031FED704